MTEQHISLGDFSYELINTVQDVSVVPASLGDGVTVTTEGINMKLTN